MPVRQLGYEVSLWSDGAEIPSYNVESVNENTVTCYIPSEAGKEFTVKFRNEVVFGHGAAFYVHMDGREMQGLSVYPYEHTTMKGVYETLSAIRPFEFARLKLKEDDEGEIADSSVDMAKLGLIEVRVCRATLTPDEFGSGDYRPRRVQAELDAVSEKAKKVGWHSVSLGKTKALATAANVPRITYIDPKDQPYAIFRFRYQPREILEDQGIIPPRPRSATLSSPGPSTGKRPRRDDTSDRPHKRHASVKAEPGPSTRVKREAEVVDLTGRREPSPIRVPESAQGEVFDLTDD